MAEEPLKLRPGETRYVRFPLDGSMALMRPCATGYYLKPIGLEYTNYQLSIVLEDATISLPLLLLESLACVKCDTDLSSDVLEITTKSVWIFRIAFHNAVHLGQLLRTHEKAFPRDLDSTFAIAYKAALLTSGKTLADDRGWSFYSPEAEVRRQMALAEEVPGSPSLNSQEAGNFRIFDYNWNAAQGYVTYPSQIVVPTALPDQTLLDCMAFRSKGRMPAVSWIHARKSGILARASQPLVGLRGANSPQDEIVCSQLAVRRGTRPNWNPASPDETTPPNDNSFSRSTDLDASLSLSTIAQILPTRHSVLQFVDARSQIAAGGNMTRGGGFETPSSKAYPPNTKISFFGMGNIHAIRESFLKLRRICTNYSNSFEAMPGEKNGNHGFWAKLEDCQWYLHIQRILWGAVRIVDMLERGESVLVHCSDGWDRTPQLTATAMLLLDPYYRTTAGFITLIEQEWLRFGHKFDERCGHFLTTAHGEGSAKDDIEDEMTSPTTGGPGTWLSKKLKGDREGEKTSPAEHPLSSQRSPIFIQWADTVYQIMVQFPNEFEFTPELLQFIVDHAYSCQYGTFMCNNEFERAARKISDRTWSLWTDLLEIVEEERLAVQRILSLATDVAEMPKTAFLNPMYSTDQKGRPLHPSHNSKNLVVWSPHFFRFDAAQPYILYPGLRQRPSLFDSSSSAANYRLMLHTREQLLKQMAAPPRAS
eukprot:TRINITY_DN94926_c0_g1_i1.p1 TRINITY_DN94926_c0_g1~~TRINITY_DN94926_c0_g1_i1.p1  ORF type:complete len:713 (-),score=95.15 TRINITY_DN94926_c0_g1_i1:49-2166(-)